MNDYSGEPSSAAQSWHTKSVKAVLKALITSSEGLSKEEVTSRLTKYGANQLPEAKARGPLLRFLYQFHNVLIYVLIAASAVTAILEHWVDASVIL